MPVDDLFMPSLKPMPTNCDGAELSMKSTEYNVDVPKMMLITNAVINLIFPIIALLLYYRRKFTNNLYLFGKVSAEYSLLGSIYYNPNK